MKILLLTLSVAVVSGNPQYNYPGSSGGEISPEENGTPYKRLSRGYEYNKPSAGNGKAPIASSFPFGMGGDSGFPEGKIGPQGQIIPNIDYGQPPVIQKNVYIHIPPPELEENPEAPAPLPVGPPEKNYKIIFIKAPAPSQSLYPIIPPQPPKEEKTLVYVLVKKPEEAIQPVIPTAEPTQPSKPEVFFIRYNTVKEAGATGLEDGYSKGGEGQPAPSSGYQTGGAAQTGGSDAQGYPSQKPGGQGAGYLPPDKPKPINSGSY